MSNTNIIFLMEELTDIISTLINIHYHLFSTKACVIDK